MCILHQKRQRKISLLFNFLITIIALLEILDTQTNCLLFFAYSEYHALQLTLFPSNNLSTSSKERFLAVTQR